MAIIERADYRHPKFFEFAGTGWEGPTRDGEARPCLSVPMADSMNDSAPNNHVESPKHLVVHIGLQKTGTTSLQRGVFRHLPNYFGPGLTPGTNLGLPRFRELRSVIQDMAPEVWGYREMQDEREHLRLLGQKLGARGDRALISFENLIATPFFRQTGGPYQRQRLQESESTQHIAQILDLIAPNRETTSVLVTVRQQWTWLPSLYAQMSDRNPRASQKNFELQVRRYLSEPSIHLSPLNIAHLSDRVVQEIKPDNLTLLPMETMGTKGYDMALRAILEPLIPQGATFDLPRLNRRRQNDDSWNLRKYGSGLLSAGLPATRNPLVSLIDGWRHQGKPGQSFKQISLNETLEDEIRGRVEPWNRLVEEKFTPIGLPGYFSPGTLLQPSDEETLRKGK